MATVTTTVPAIGTTVAYTPQSGGEKQYRVEAHGVVLQNTAGDPFVPSLDRTPAGAKPGATVQYTTKAGKAKAMACVGYAVFLRPLTGAGGAFGVAVDRVRPLGAAAPAPAQQVAAPSPVRSAPESKTTTAKPQSPAAQRVTVLADLASRIAALGVELAELAGDDKQLAEAAGMLEHVFLRVRNATSEAMKARDAEAAASRQHGQAVVVPNVNAASATVDAQKPAAKPQGAAKVRCPATKADGTPCKAYATATGRCMAHSKAATAPKPLPMAAAAQVTKPAPVTVTVDADKAAALAKLAKLPAAVLAKLAGLPVELLTGLVS